MLNLKDRTMLVEEKTSLKNNRMSGYEFLKKMVFSWMGVIPSVIRALGKHVQFQERMLGLDSRALICHLSHN